MEVNRKVNKKNYAIFITINEELLRLSHMTYKKESEIPGDLKY